MGDEIESSEVAESRSSVRLSLQRYVSSFGSRSSSNNNSNSNRNSGRNSKISDGNTTFDEEIALQWAAIERLPTFKRSKTSLFFDDKEAAAGTNDTRKRQRPRVVDVSKLDASERHTFIHNLIKHIENDNLRLLHNIRTRIHKVGIELPTVEVRYDNLHIQAECEVVYGKPLPTLWHSFKRLILDLARLPGLKSEMSRMDIIDGVSGVIKPGRMTLLLGPPGCGKSTLLKALSGNLDKSLKTSGEISYNEHSLKELVPQKHSAYISQQDLHIPDMTVRETLDFSSCCQGVGIRAEIMAELSRREKIAGILPDPDIDTYMKAIAVEGEKATLQTDYVLRILGLGVCADTQIGDVMRRGISGGQKKRLTTGEMVVGPTKALFMDEISNGLDSSTTYEIVACLQHLAHITDATIVVSLLQPAPETFDLFDDIILLAEGKIVYHGPRENVVEFFESCGFRCPQRKGISDFLQEVISKKDQEQYWYNINEAYSYHSVDKLSNIFKESSYGKIIMEQLSQPLAKSKSSEGAISFSAYSMPKLSLFKVCMWREFLLMKRNAFVYGFKAVQLFIVGCITMTMFLRSRMGNIDLANADYYMGALFYGLINFLLDGYPELAMTVSRLPVFYKQRDLCFYPAWAYAVPTAILKIPVSLLAAAIWTCLTYYVIGYSPGLGRFLRQMLLLFSVHLTSQSLFRFLASLAQTTVASGAIGSFSLVFLFVFSGFIIPRPSMPKWLQWGFWISPLSYGEIGLALDEFQSRRWHEMLPINATVGQQTLQKHGLNFDGYVFWISIGALFGFALLFNIGFTLALTLLRAPGSRSIISQDKFSRKKKHIEADKTTGPQEVNMVLPFQPLTVVFQNLQYHIEPTSAMKGHGFGQKKLQLLHEMTGTFRPGVLTALMGVSGAGKTTLFDVLAGRKTTGTIEGEIKIGGYPKVQRTFARISGYCEQTDLHSPNITVEESVIFSAWLRLPPEIDSRTKYNLVKSVLETIELDEIKDAMVGMPGANALSNEQRKRLTIAVELVANPSIIFLDEPTTGLDARAAAIVMRAVKNVADTGRTIVCTIHQPSIHIFETFDEIILLKSGGRLIYCGPLGQHSKNIIEYFESIPNVPKIRNSYNPATWILEITSSSSEAKLGVDFEEIYKNSALHKYNKELAETMSLPPPETKDLDFSSVFSQDGWGQFKTCLWRHSLSYWRCPSYNLRRLMFMFILSLMFGGLFWNQGKKIENQQSLFNLFGSMFTAVIFCGMNNSVSVLPYVTIERTVFYRERFSGMYAFWAHALAQVVMEIPYNLVQAVVFTAITYPMIGYNSSGYKVFWYCYAMFCTLFYYTSLGMMVVSITPSYPVAVMLQSAFNTFLTLFAGFLVPPPRIPKWWIWFYYITPTGWSLRGMITSQYGDIHENIEVFEGVKSVATFLEDYYGFHHKQLPIVGVVLILFPIIFAVVFAFSIEYLRFQRR